MNNSFFARLLVGTSLTFFLVSCENSTDKTSEATADTTKEMAAPTVTTSNIDTMPQTILIVRHKVADYAKWKSSYDGHDTMRQAHGVHNYVIGRGVEDSNTIMVAVKVDDLAKAKAFAKDPSLKAAMQKGGVIGMPIIRTTTVVYSDVSPNMSDLRSMTFINVKDWGAWKTSFESYRQLRSDNGLTDRAYGYDTDDNKKVILVVAINDSAKANAFWNGDVIKQKRLESGTIGVPERFVYRVVQKY